LHANLLIVPEARVARSATAVLTPTRRTLMAEQSLLCWGCGKEPPEGVKFQRCERCAEQKLPSSYFCGEACMLANWPRHKAWHKEQKEGSVRCSLAASLDRSLAERTAREAENTGSEKLRLGSRAMSLTNEGDLQGAARMWRKLLKLSPEDGDVHCNLAMTLTVSNRGEEAAQLYLKAMELYVADTAKWASAVAKAFNLLRTADMPKPQWWNDADLKALSARVVATLPDDPRSDANLRPFFACYMRAVVLAGGEILGESLWPDTGPRTIEEIKEAAVMCRRASALIDERDEYAVSMAEIAAECDEVADRMLAEAEAEAAAARKAAEAEAKEAREVAEAKAAAAAEELLAEEEKEQEQAVAKNKTGNSKGKGKKGKGKRS